MLQIKSRKSALTLYSLSFLIFFFRNNLKFQAKVSSNPQLQLPQPTSEATKASIMDNLSKMPLKQ